MAKTQKRTSNMSQNTSNSSKRATTSRRSRDRSSGPKRITDRRNYQDDAEIKEYDKGYKKGSNDIAWYNKYPSILKDSASFVYGYPAGYQPVSTVIPNGKYGSGALEVLVTSPSVGYSNDATSPVNIAAAEIFNAVRRDQTGSSPFEQADLMLYCLAAADVYSYITFLERIYGTLDLITLQNDFTPDVLLVNQGVNPQNLRENRASFRAGINLLISYAAAFCVPANMMYFKRAAFRYQNYYSDGNDIKSSLYMLTPSSFYLWSQGTEASAAGTLTHSIFRTPAAVQAGGYTYTQLLDYGFNLISPLRRSSDIQFMSAAILKAFGDGGVMSLSMLPEYYPIAPIFNQEVLCQFKGATVPLPIGANDADLDSIAFTPAISSSLRSNVTQQVAINNSYIVSNPGVRQLAATAGAYPATQGANNIAIVPFAENLLLAGSTFGPNSPEYAVEATRLACRMRPSQISTFGFITEGSSSKVYSVNTGVEVVLAGYYVAPDALRGMSIGGIDFKMTWIGCAQPLFIGDYAPTSDNFAWNELSYAALTLNGRIDYSPAIYNYTMQVNGSDTITVDDVQIQPIHFDLNNYAIVTPSELEQLNRIALFSLFSM